MKRMKRFIAVLLTVLMIATAVPYAAFPVSAAASADIIWGTEAGITRAEWLHNLTVIFDMEVGEESLPDNYFSDLDSTHPYYEDILMAVQYGVVDIEAGEALYPDELVTRDFAVVTLNFCMGYQLAEDAIYIFVDREDCTDPESAQIAINRGWLWPINGVFTPEKPITTDEIEAMLNDAAAVLEEQVVDADYESAFELAEDVVIIPEGTTVEEGENSQVLITDCPETIAEGDLFAVYQNGIPVVYTALSVSVIDSVTTIQTEESLGDDAFTAVDAEGVIDSGAMEIVPADGVELTVDEESVSTFALDGVKQLKTFTLSKKHSFGALTGKISLTMANPYVEYSISGESVYVALCGQATISFNFSASLASAAGLGSITLGSLNIGGVGSLDLTLNADLSGSATGAVEGWLVVGLSWQEGDDLRAVRSFNQTASYTNVEGEARVSLKASLGVTKMPVVKAYVYAEIGVLAKISVKTYADEVLPHQCTHFSAYLFAKYGASASVKFIGFEASQSVSNNIFSESNSPYRVVYHYEDGMPIGSCTRGQDYSKFFTKSTSRWSGCGWIGANGAYGLDGSGVPVPLYTYTLNENNEATITKYNGNSWSVYIPKDIDGYTVVGIGNRAFAEKDVGYVKIPDTVTEIGNRAFSNCTVLSDVTLPNSLISLGYDSFYNCDSLEKINIPKSLKNANWDSYYSPGVIYYTPFRDCDGLKTIEFETGITSIVDNLFWSCAGLEEVEIPDTVTKIGANAFRDCSELKEMKLPDTVTEIGNRAFSNCALMSGINLPSSLNSLGYDAFYNCDSLEKINIPKSLKNANWDDYYTMAGTIYYTPFRDCDGLKTIEFETGITSIVDNLFWSCAGLEEVEIPDTVTKIGANAFRDCSELKKVKLPDTVTEIGNRAFSNCTVLSDVTLPNSLISLGYDSFYNCDSLEKINIPKSLKNANWDSYYSPGVIYYTPFRDCDGLKTVEFEKGITSIVDNLFWSCTGLEKVEIPDTVTKIGADAFRDCSDLKEVNLPDTVTEIGNRAFYNCVSLTSIEIPSAVTVINEYMFYNCKALKSIEIPDNIVSIEDYSFYGCSSLERVKLPDTLKNITSYLFYNCSSLKTIDFPKTVQTIQNSAFYGCSSLESISFADDSALAEIQSSAFYGCSSLKEVVLPETVKSIGENAFQNCTALEKVYIPRATKTLGYYAFSGCENLSDVTISDYSIKEIKTETFMNCPALESIVLPKGLTTIGAAAFKNDTALVSVTIPESVTSIASDAFSYPAKTTIYGKSGSYAETFANDGGFTFKDISIPVEGIILKDGVENVTLDVGETYFAEFEFYPEDANEVVVLTANNNKVTIDGHDIYARYSGDTVITATTASGMTYDFYIHVRSFRNLEIVTKPTKTTYLMGEEFDPTGMVVQVNYHDNTTKTVTDYTVSGFDSSAEGTCTVTVNWIAADGFKQIASFPVTIINPAPKLTGIEIGTLPNKVNYALREKLDTTGMVVLGVYTDGSRKEITDYTVSGYNALKKGEQTVTVKSGEFSTTFTVTVGADKTLTGIEITTEPTKVEYEIGEALDTAGLVLTLTYSDGSTETKTDGFTVSGFDASAAGACIVTVTYGGMTDTFTATVKAAQSGILGDANGSGGVDMSDVITIIKAASGATNENYIAANADYNQSGNVDMADAVALLNGLAG